MRKLSIIFITIFGLISVSAYRSYRNDDVVVGTLAIGTSALSSASALFEVSTNTLGWLPPRLTTTAKNAIASPATGLSLFDTTLVAPAFYTGSVWRQVCSLNGTETLTNKTINPSVNTISLASASLLIGSGGGVAAPQAITGDISLTNAGVTSYSTTVPISKGGTGQTTQSTGFNALSPMTTLGDVIYGGASGTGTRLGIGSEAQVLKVVSGVPAWATAAVAGSSDALTIKTTNYVITGGEGTIVFDTSTEGSLTATLPTAVGRGGEIFKIVKQTPESNSVTINTTSSQTVGLRASGSIILTGYGDYVEVQSNGANYEILSKREHEYVLATSAAFSLSTMTAGNYADLTGNSITISPGLWEVNAGFRVNLASGADVIVEANSGLYAANGNDTTTVPTSLSGTVAGPQSYNSLLGGQPLWMVSGTNAKQTTVPLRIYTSVTVNSTIYMVPKLDFVTAGTATITAWITGKRIY